MAIDKIFKSSNVDDLADNILSEVDDFMVSVDKMQQRKVAGNVQKVIQAFKQIETDLQDRYDNVTDVIEKRVSTIKDGRDGLNGTDGRNGRDGKPGRDGINGKQGPPGTPGKDGEDGLDGVSVTNANIDFDGSLVISLSSGQQINVGEIVPPELERQLVELRQGGGSAGSSGDVMGPTASTDNAIVRFDGTTGKLVQNSVVTIADTTGNMVGVGAMGIGTPTISSGYSLDVQNGLVLARIESTTGTNAALFVIKNTAGKTILGNEGSTASTFTGASNYASILGTDSARALQFATNNTVRFEINSAGIVATYGAMTVGGTLGVTGATTVDGTLSATGTAYLASSVANDRQLRVTQDATRVYVAAIDIAESLVKNLRILGDTVEIYSGAGNAVLATFGTSIVFTPSGTTTLSLSANSASVTGALSATTTGQVGTTLGVGGATPSTSGSGITFPATQSVSSNANTLDDYEEGTWTPNQGSGLTVVGAFSSIGRYTKIGNVVTVWGDVTGGTSISVAAVGFICSNLPFSMSSDIGAEGSATGFWTSMNSVAHISIGNLTSIYSAQAISGSATIGFTITYRV